MKIKTFLAASLAALALISCDSEGTNEYHSTYFYPLTQNGIVTYADQTSDTTYVTSYDSWTLSNTCDWCKVSCNGQEAPLSVTVPAGYSLTAKLNFTLTPNTTGALRTNRIEVVSSYAKIGTVATYVAQYPFLHVENPAVSQKSENNITTYTFSMQVDATGKLTSGANHSITFTVFTDDATLSSSDETWLKPLQTQGFEKEKSQKVELEISKNETGADRSATLTLTSNGISTPISVTQKAAE